MSILHRLILLVVLALLPVAGYQIGDAIQMRSEGEAALRAQAAQYLSLIQGEQARLVDGVRQTLMTLGETVGLPDDCQPVMERLKGRIPSHIILNVVGTDGYIRCSTDPNGIGMFIGDRDHVQAALAGTSFAIGSHIVMRADGHTPALPFAVPLRGGDGKVIGTVTALLVLDWLTRYLEDRPLPANASLIVADRNGVVLARQPKLASVVGTQLPLAYRPLVTAKSGGTTEAEGLDGRLRVVAYSPPASEVLPGLFFSVGIDKEAAMGWVDRDLSRSLGILFLLLLAGIAGAWWAGHFFVRVPVATLTAAAERWRAGDFKARAEIAVDASELGRLAGSFNAMAESLEETSRVRGELLALLAAVIREMPSGLSVSEWPSGKLLFQNDEAERLLGDRDRQGMTDIHLACTGAEHADGTLYAIDDYPTVRTAKTGAVIHNEEMICRRLDGSATVLSVSTAPVVDEVGRVRLVVTTFQDIADRKALEAALRVAKEAAEQASRSKSRFLAAASHDLRQPLQSLLLFADLLSPHVATDKGKETLGIVVQGLETLRALLDSLLDISRLDAGTVSVEIRTFPLADLFDQMAAAYRPVADRKGLAFTVHDCNHDFVRSDPILLGRIIRNLLDNAFRYTTTGEVRIDCRASGRDMVIEVHDTGTGIPADQLERIFDEFHRGPAAGPHGEPGLGLGLSIVRRLAGLLNHQVSVRSEEGAGSVFTVRVPRVWDARLPTPEIPRTAEPCMMAE